MTKAVAVTAPGGLYNFFVLLHVVCVVGGFGALVYRSFVLDLARRRGNVVAAGVLGVFGQVVQVGEFLLYGAGVFGALAALTDKLIAQQDLDLAEPGAPFRWSETKSTVFVHSGIQH